MTPEERPPDRLVPDCPGCRGHPALSFSWPSHAATDDLTAVDVSLVALVTLSLISLVPASLSRAWRPDSSRRGRGRSPCVHDQAKAKRVLYELKRTPDFEAHGIGHLVAEHLPALCAALDSLLTISTFTSGERPRGRLQPSRTRSWCPTGPPACVDGRSGKHRHLTPYTARKEVDRGRHRLGEAMGLVGLAPTRPDLPRRSPSL